MLSVPLMLTIHMHNVHKKTNIEFKGIMIQRVFENTEVLAKSNFFVILTPNFY